jgi:hypothetical protein
MPPTNSQPTSPSTPPQSIPLRDLTRPPDSVDAGDGSRRHNRGRSLLSGGSRPTSGGNAGPRYERLGDTSPSPTERASNRPSLAPSLALQRVQDSSRRIEDEAGTPTSPVGNPADFQAAMGFAGLLVPDISVSHAPRTHTPSYASYGSADFDGISPYGDAGDDHNTYFTSESDTMPLTDPAALQPNLGVHPSTPTGQQHDRSRSSFQSISFNTPERGYRQTMLGDNLADIEAGLDSRHARSHSYGNSLTPDSRARSRSPSNASGALSRAGSIVRAMSQRVVNMSADAETIEAAARRQAEREAGRIARETREPSVDPIRDANHNVPGGLGSLGSLDSYGTLASLSDESETRYQPKHKKDPLAAGPHLGRALQAEAPIEKAIRFFGGKKEARTEEQQEKPPNPLRGKSLGIFSQDSIIRNKLCDILVYPLTEPVILILIIAQTVLLAVDASKSVYDYPRPLQWGQSSIDYALLVLFVIFTLEITARIIVSGFIRNAPEYSTIRHKKGLKNLVLEKYRTVFKPERKSSVRAPRNDSGDAHTIVRSFTAIQGDLVRTVEQAQRLQLARRAFLRHSFNRLDLVAILAFWAAFILGVTGIEDSFHLYIFRMLSCLRILRLLALTNGTAVSWFPRR